MIISKGADKAKAGAGKTVLTSVASAMYDPELTASI